MHVYIFPENRIQVLYAVLHKKNLQLWSDIWPMRTYRQKKPQTQDGIEMVQRKKLFKLDSLKAV